MLLVERVRARDRDTLTTLSRGEGSEPQGYGPEPSIHMRNVSFARPAPVSAWCQKCQKLVALRNLRPGPEGVLAVGECPQCHAKLAAKKPIEWGSTLPAA